MQQLLQALDDKHPYDSKVRELKENKRLTSELDKKLDDLNALRKNMMISRASLFSQLNSFFSVSDYSVAAKKLWGSKYSEKRNDPESNDTGSDVKTDNNITYYAILIKNAINSILPDNTPYLITKVAQFNFGAGYEIYFVVGDYKLILYIPNYSCYSKENEEYREFLYTVGVDDDDREDFSILKDFNGRYTMDDLVEALGKDKLMEAARSYSRKER